MDQYNKIEDVIKDIMDQWFHLKSVTLTEIQYFIYKKIFSAGINALMPHVATKFNVYLYIALFLNWASQNN